LSYVAWQPFVRPDYDLWQADDGESHLLRIYLFDVALRHGQWLPRWIPEMFVGYGYPIFNFYAPGTYYAAFVLRALSGADPYGAAQALGALATGTGAAGAYCFTRAVFGGFWPGLIAALAYVYAPYPFITNLLIRADLAEVLGLALLPWTLLSAWHAGRRRRAVPAIPLTLGMGAMMLTHNLSALITLPAALVVGLFAASRTPGHFRQGILAVVSGLVLALALTAFFWVPAMVEQRHVQIEVALHGGHKAATSWLIDPLGATAQTRRSGNPQTVEGPLDLHASYPYDLSYPPKPSLGQGLLFGAAMGLILLLHRRPRAAEAAFFLAGTIFLWYCTTTWSAWLWELVPMMRFLQFSWRLYGPLSLALGLAAGGATALLMARQESRDHHQRTPEDPLQTNRTWLPAFNTNEGSGHIVRTALALLLPVALVAFLAFNTTTARWLWLHPHPEREVSGTQLRHMENTIFGAGTTSGGEFVPRTVDLAGGDSQRRGNGIYERLYPEFGWIAGRVMALEGHLRITSLHSGTSWTDARVQAETPGVLAFHTIFFPGWRAYLDGREVTPGLAPRDPHLGIAPGFMTVDVPAGEHRVQIAFGPTPIRTASAVVSVLTLAGLGWWLAVRTPLPSPLPQGERERSALTRETTLSRAARRNRAHLKLLLCLAPAALFGLAAGHDALRPLLRAPVRPGPADMRLAASLMELTRNGQVTISSPSGASLGPFVNLQQMRIGGRERPWLYMHPLSSVSTMLDLPPRAAFQAGLGVDPRAWSAETGDGVRFVVEVTPAGGQPVRVLDEHLNPRAFDDQRRWVDRWVDLSAFGGQRVTLTLRTEPGPTADNDWAGWADPVIIVQADARRSGGGSPGPVPTPRAS
ncbi:MAG TPA: 6-pyruvoyl-tetrahydropterin synthase-related protein, partial [Chloroflexota bacterium]|nr:6-pyruvoyl-tetrahydropterin synthase-related protein [Chloroflexota bacterium]